MTLEELIDRSRPHGKGAHVVAAWLRLAPPAMPFTARPTVSNRLQRQVSKIASAQGSISSISSAMEEVKIPDLSTCMF